MNIPPLVSVIITLYNRENYVEQAIESVLDSGYKNYELLIVDDKSTDNSASIIKKYIHHPQVKLYFNDKNLGQFENRNYAASLACGTYIKYLDSDDILYKYGLDIMVDIIERFPDAGAAISHNTPNEERPYPILMNCEECYLASYLKGGFPHSGPSAAIINRKAFNRIGGFPKPYYVGTDSIFWLKLAARYPIVKMQPNLIWYRQHEGQALAQGIQSNEYLKNDYFESIQLLNDTNCPLTLEDNTKAKKLLKKRFIHHLCHLALNQRSPKKALYIFHKSGLTLRDLNMWK